MRKVLITGGQGFIGNHLTDALLRNNFDVATLDSQFNNRNVTISNPKHLKRYNASTTNMESVQRSMDGCSIVFHLANRTDWSDSFRHPMRLVDSNIRGLVTVLAAAQQSGVSKIIISSSYEVYGNQINAKETDPLVPVNVIASIVAAAENIARGYYQSGLDIVILRLGKVWGRDCNSIVAKFIKGDTLVEGDPDRTRDFIHIDDCVHALMSAISWDSNIYNVGTGDEVTIRGLWERLNLEKTLLPQRLKGYATQQRISLDPEFTKTNVNWEATIKIADMNSEEIRKHCQL